MSLKPRYFAYKDQTGSWVELDHEPTPAEVNQYRDFEVFYTALAVETALGNYRSFFDEIGKRLSLLPEWLQKFYFDLKRRIDHEHQTRNRKEVREGKPPIGERKSRWGADHGKGRV